MDDTEQLPRAEAHLADRLLRGGVGMRHVRRTLRELRDHREDLVERLVAQGHDRAAATQEANRLLGSQESLVAHMTACPQLRSRARRFAWLLFVLGPLPLIAALDALALLAGSTIFLATGMDPQAHPQLQLFLVRAVLQWIGPLLAGLLLCRIAAARRMPPAWPFCAIAMAALISGATHYHVTGTTKTLALAPFIHPDQSVLLFCALGLTYLALRGRWPRLRLSGAS